MTYDSNEPGNRGNTKISELAVDRQLPLFDASAAQQNALVAMEVAFRAITNVARRTNFMLRSEGQIQWTGSEIRFDALTIANSINLEILASEGSINSSFSIRMQGSTTANGASTFLNLPMSDGDLLYLELDATLLVDQGSSFNLANAVNGGGITPGLRVLKQPMTTAMPKLQIGAAGSGSLFYIPLALRRGTDILWIPHGITWPQGVTSKLGAVIVSGFDAYPERFATSQAELLTALSDFSILGGGVVLIKQAFTVSQIITLPDNVKILGRGRKNDITLAAGGGFLLQNRSTLEGLKIVTAAAWTGQAAQLNGTRNRVKDTWIDLSAAANSATVIGVQVAGNGNRITDSSFSGVLATSRIGINYSSGTDNADIDCEFT